jgi:hypothetical protein
MGSDRRFYCPPEMQLFHLKHYSFKVSYVSVVEIAPDVFTVHIWEYGFHKRNENWDGRTLAHFLDEHNLVEDPHVHF